MAVTELTTTFSVAAITLPFTYSSDTRKDR